MEAIQDAIAGLFHPGWPMEALKYFLVALIAYLLGSLNFAIIISRAVFKQDIRTQGSKNAGSTNAFRVMGKKWGTVVALGDIAKGAAAVLVGYGLALALNLTPDMAKLVGGLLAIIGHCFPLYFGFKGGKGVMTTAAVMLFVDTPVALVALAVFAVVVVLTRYISLGSMLAALSLIPASLWLFHRSGGFGILTVVVALAIVLLHRKNIGRLLKGQESKVSLKKKKSGEPVA